jgi:hypothetical protein
MVMYDLGDMWIVPLFALALLIASSVYLVKIHRQIGRQLTQIFAGFQAIGYVYLGMLIHTFIVLNAQIGAEPVDIYRLFFGFFFPVADRILHLKLKRFYVKGLQPNRDRDSERDIKRDATRDVERDINRDRERDMRRDLYKDKDSDNINSS